MAANTATFRLDWSPARPAEGPCAVATGTFDGVHLGHQVILKEAAELARRKGWPCVALTFEPHPRAVLRPVSGPLLLTSLEQRVELLLRHGADACAVLHFDRAVAATPAGVFVERVLVERLRAGAVVAGFNFAFGRGREGSVHTLLEVGRRLGFEVRVVDPVRFEGHPVSSTTIRGLLRQGRVDRAGTLLGRPYTVRGQVVAGEGRGRALGYPTANVRHHPEQLLPAHGVYTAWTRLLGDEEPATAAMPSLAVVSTRPTFGGEPVTWLEVHVLGQGSDWYGRVAEVAFLKWVRPIRAFGSVADLAAQIDSDRQEALRFFEGLVPTPF